MQAKDDMIDPGVFWQTPVNEGAECGSELSKIVSCLLNWETFNGAWEEHTRELGRIPFLWPHPVAVGCSDCGREPPSWHGSQESLRWR